MEITVHGKQIDVGDALRTHIQDKIQDVCEKYFDHTAFATVTLSKEGHGHGQFKAHISIQAGKNILINADDIEHDPYVAFDSACDKAAKQLRRHKRRLRDDHGRMEHTPEQESIKARNYVLADLPDESDHDETTTVSNDTDADPVVIAEMATQIDTMSVSDAVMRMDLANAQVMMFRNSKSHNLNVVYRRDDGNVGWIDPDNQVKSKTA